MIPLYLNMIGLPFILLVFVPGYFYPINGRDPRYQHYFLLSLTAWFLTVGPKESLYKSIRDIFVAEEKPQQKKESELTNVAEEKTSLLKKKKK